MPASDKFEGRHHIPPSRGPSVTSQFLGSQPLPLDACASLVASASVISVSLFLGGEGWTGGGTGGAGVGAGLEVLEGSA
jgi:hypothetical protein